MDELNKKKKKERPLFELDSEGNKVYQMKEFTTLEQQYFDAYKEKHKENIIKPQVVQGKTFKGNSFISKPEKIFFKDFTVGEPMEQNIKFTNVSFTKNSFKLLPMAESIRDFFDVIYTPSGKISAGMSVNVFIRLNPQINEDISDFFPILAETGQINIPLECTYKKAKVKILNPIIDFGNVIFGEKCTKQLKLENEGALTTEVRFKTRLGADLKIGESSIAASSLYGSQKQSQKSNLTEEDDEEEANFKKCMNQLQFQKSGIIQGYNSLSIEFTFIPENLGKIELTLMTYFENFRHSPPIDIKVRGQCVEVPIYVEKPIYDFEICLLNHSYREKLVFYNRQQNAMKIQIVPPKETKNFFEFNPQIGYIQGHSKFEIWVKMTTNKELLNMCGKFIKDEILDVPFKLIGADQVLPVPFSIRSQLTLDSIQIKPQIVDFGKIFQGTAQKFNVVFSNISSLPQQLILYPLPKEIEIEPDLIPLTILPNDDLGIDLFYRGKEAKIDDGLLNFKVVTGEISTRDIKIPFHCEVVKCPLQFSSLMIQMPALQINEKYNTNIHIRNASSTNAIKFEIFLPYYEICGLKITPVVSSLMPEKELDITVEYNSFFKEFGPFTYNKLKEKYENDPDLNLDLKLQLLEKEKLEKAKQEEMEKSTSPQKGQKKVDPKQQTDKGLNEKDKKQAAQKTLTKAQQKELELEQQRQAELEQIKKEEEEKKLKEIEQNFNQYAELLKLGGKVYEFNKGSEQHSQHYTWLIPLYFKFEQQSDQSKQVIYLEIQTVSVEQTLVASQTSFDFGEVAVGFRKIQELFVSNVGPNELNLQMELLPLCGGFNVINAIRKLDVGKTKNLVIEFEPHDQQTFKQLLKIFGETTSISIKLKGKGVRPNIEIEPENGLLNAGPVLLEEYVEKSFIIKNTSNFQIYFKILSKAKGKSNNNGSEVFSFIPSESALDAKSKLEIKVIFKPDNISEKFYELIAIDVPNQIKEQRIFLFGACYPRSSYICYWDPYLKIPQEKDLQKKIEFPFDMLRKKEEQNIFSQFNNVILLQFQKPKNEEEITNNPLCTKRKLIIGNCKLLDNKLEKPSGFDIIMPKDDKSGFFQCDNLKGTISAGQEIIATFAFKPPQLDQFIQNIEALTGIGQWIEQKAELKLSGGFIKLGITDIISFDIILKAYINQI